MSIYAYLSGFLINAVPYDPKLANGDTRVGYPVLFGIQAPVEGGNITLEMKGGAEFRNRAYRAVSVVDAGNSFKSDFRTRLLVVLPCAGGPEAFSMKGMRRNNQAFAIRTC